MRRPVAVICCVIGACFSLVSLPFLGFAYLFYASSTNSLSGTIQTNGTIVTTCNGDTSATCHPIVSFRTQSGKSIQFASNFSSSTMHAGDTVPVNYHPKDPQDAVISSFTSLWLFPVLLGGIGGFILLVAIILFILALVFALGRRSRTSKTSAIPTTPTAPTAFVESTVPSESMAPTVPSISMTPTIPVASKYPYHDPEGYNPYR